MPGTPAEPKRSTSAREKSPVSEAAGSAFCRSFSCPSSFPAWHSRSVASNTPSPTPPPRSEPGPHPSRPEGEPEEGELRVLVKAASLALAVHDPVFPGMQPDADLLHPLLQRIQHGLGPGLGRQCTRRQAACEAVGGRLSAARSWRSSSKAAWLETPRRARGASRVIGCPCWSWYSAAARAREREQDLVLIVPGRGWPSRRGQLAGAAVLAVGYWAGVAGGAALDHGDRDEAQQYPRPRAR